MKRTITGVVALSETETNPYAKLRLEVLLKLKKLANSGTYSASQLF
jgi:hypothetical protein